MLVHCLRHGATEANLARRFNGTRDDPLTEAQRHALQNISFDHTRYDAIYCSPLRRAVETAECLGISRWISEPRIAERHLGIFEGLTANECHDLYPDEFAAFCAFDAEFQIPTGETRGQNFARVAEWIQDISSYGQVLAITHGGTIDFLYRLGSGCSLHGGKRIYSSDNASLSIFEVDWPDVRLIDYNIDLGA